MDFRKKQLWIGMAGIALVAGCVAAEKERQKHLATLQKLAPSEKALRDSGPWTVCYHQTLDPNTAGADLYHVEFGPFMTSMQGPSAIFEQSLKLKEVQTVNFSTVQMMNWYEVLSADGDRVRLEVGAQPESLKLGSLEVPMGHRRDRIGFVSRGDEQLGEIQIKLASSGGLHEPLGKILIGDQVIIVRNDCDQPKSGLFASKLQVGFFDGNERIGFVLIRLDEDRERLVWIAEKLPKNTRMMIAAACAMRLEMQADLERVQR